MLDKLKEIGKLKALQDSMKSVRFEVERQGVRMVINGNLQIEEVELNQDLPVEEQSQIVKDCFNEAVSKAQRGMAEKLAGMNLGF